jgi:hypothetical protein
MGSYGKMNKKFSILDFKPAQMFQKVFQGILQSKYPFNGLVVSKKYIFKVIFP